MGIRNIGHCSIRHRKIFICVCVRAYVCMCACVCVHTLSHATPGAIPQMPSTSLAPFIDKLPTALAFTEQASLASQGATCLCFSNAWIMM